MVSTRKPRATTTTKKPADPVLSKLADALERMRLKVPIEGEEREKIDKLLKNPRNNKINLVGRAFRVGEQGSSQMYTGLTHKLHDKFWPDTDENPMNPACQERKRKRRPSGYRPSDMKSKCKTHGAKHGTRVHKQVYKITSGMAQGKKIKPLLRALDACTIRIFNFFVKKGWFPVASELMIWDETWMVATAIDIIVYDIANKRLIAIETKTGYEDEEYMQHPIDTPMRAPLGSIINCPYNRHCMQLLCNLQTLSAKYNYKVDAAYIMRSCPRTSMIYLYDLPKWAHNKQIQLNLYSTMSKR